MALSTYHERYLQKTSAELLRRVEVKEYLIRQVIEQTAFAPISDPIRIAVLGCAVRTFVTAHAEIFQRVLGVPVDVTTFDITIEHLSGEEGVVQHDCTKPLPGGPYDLVYSDVLLKFVETEKQWAVLEHAFSALAPGGMAMHVMGDKRVVSSASAEGLYPVPFDRWIAQLSQLSANACELVISIPLLSGEVEHVWVLQKPRS